MKGYRSGVCCLLLLFPSLALGACGTGKFSNDFASEIQQDCIQTVACSQAGHVESCIAAVGTQLDQATTSQQQFFVDTVYRCQRNATCDYVNCTQSTTASGYVATHTTQITFDCQQRSECRASSGQTVSPSAVQQCIQETGNRLNADPSAQAAYDARYTRCQSFMGCSWGACQ